LELANRERLSINKYFETFSQLLNDDQFSTLKWLKWIYQEYIFEQHEKIALEKLRYQNYDTFKFYFEEGSFYWPIGKAPYQEPIRLAGNRLNNCLTMLTDLNLVIKKEDDALFLSEQGEKYHAQILGKLNGTN